VILPGHGVVDPASAGAWLSVASWGLSGASGLSALGLLVCFVGPHGVGDCFGARPNWWMLEQVAADRGIDNPPPFL